MERGLPCLWRDCQGRLSGKGAAVFVEGLSGAAEWKGGCRLCVGTVRGG